MPERHGQIRQNLSNSETKHQSAEKNVCNPPHTSTNHSHSDNSPNLTKILHGFLPHGLYNPETKKILGFLTAEDLLLIALIFLFLEDNEGDNPLLVLALLYLLVSEYFDLGDLPL
ncbi:MAG: hypothetical protein IJ285_01200 [Clostridia bacterium]|nr:hypothetical protein [Clostridia bacterium]